MTDPRDQQEPSMEEILSSIRRIIADEESGDDDKSDEDPELGAADARAEELNQDADALADAAAEEQEDDVLELTNVVRESGEVVDLKAEGNAARARAAEPTAGAGETSAGSEDDIEIAPLDAAAQANEDESAAKEHAVAAQQGVSDELLSTATTSAATGAFAKLSKAYQQKTPAEVAVADDAGRTVEQFVEDIIRPMVKDWLEENLPRIVENLVEKEIQKMARRAEVL